MSARVHVFNQAFSHTESNDACGHDIKAVEQSMLPCGGFCCAPAHFTCHSVTLCLKSCCDMVTETSTNKVPLAPEHDQGGIAIGRKTEQRKK